jgi:cytochrome c2
MFVAATLLIAATAFAEDPAIANGKTVYTAQKCQLCHSIAGVGNKKSPLDGVGKKLSAEDIKKWIVNPKEMKADTKMKAYPSLPAKDLDSLIVYMASLK